MPSYLRPWALLLLFAGCASSPPPEPEAPPTLPPMADSPEVTPTTAAPKRAVPEGSLRREDVLAVLSDGVPTFLQKIEVEPAVDREGRFVGWRVMTIRDPELAAGEVRVGDVVRKVNGLPIENPFQFFDAFQSLAFAPELKLSIERGPEQKDLAYPINDDPNAPPLPRPVTPAPSAARDGTPAGEPAPVASEAKAEPKSDKKKAKKGKPKK